MSQSRSKKIRKEIRKMETNLLPDLKRFINNRGFPARLKIAFRILSRSF